MPNSTSRSAPPERLRVGECVVDIASREVHAPGARRPIRLTPKAMAVLRVLAEQPGQVVSREHLLAEVWPDTLPTNDVVTQAITQLRKALQHAGDAAGKAGGIETIAKTGYRLLAPVAWELAAVEPVVREAVPVADIGAGAAGHEVAAAALSRAPRRRRDAGVWIGMVVAALLLVVGVAAALLSYRDRAPGVAADGGGAERVVGMPRLPYRLITSGGGFDLTPTLSPDGSMVAYASRSDARPGTSIRIQTTSNSPPRELVAPGTGESDRQPAWSPDGRELAFMRQGEDGSCRVMVAAANGAAGEHEVARCDYNELVSFSWVPGRNALLFGSMSGGHGNGGIRELDLDSGAWRDLRYEHDSRDLDHAPRYSPDGRWIAFVRNPQMGDLWLMPAAGGAPVPLTQENAEIRGWDWLPDSSGLVFGRRVDSQSRLYRLDLQTRRLHDLGLADAESPSISTEKGQLAFMQRRPQFNLFRIQRASARGAYAHERLFPSNGRDSQPMVSPDGRQLAFVSDRSGDYALWWADLARPDSLRPVEGLLPETRQPVDWAPDSRSLLAIGRDDGGRPLLYEVLPAEGRANRLPVPVPRPLQGLHVGDPGRILVLAADDGGGASLVLYDRTRQPWRELARLPDVSQARYEPAGDQVYFTRFSDGGLWRIDAALDAASLATIDQEAPGRWRYRNWALAGQGRVYYLAPGPNCFSQLSNLGAAVHATPRCVAADRFSTTNGFSVDRHDGSLYIALAAADGAGIGFMALPKAPPPALGVVSKWLIALKKSPS